MLYVNEALNASTVPGALHISQNGQVVNGTTTVSDNGQTIEFVPSAAWQYGALVQVFLDSTALDTDGSPVYSYQSQFSTVSNPTTTAPVIVNLSPASGASNVPLNAVVEIGYSEPLNAATVSASDVILHDSSGNAVPATIGRTPPGR